MAEKVMSHEELLKMVREGLENSPALAQNQAQKASFLEVYQKLETADLQRLWDLLQQEGVDWQAWIATADTKRQEILDQAQQEAVGFVKNADKTALKAHEKQSTAQEAEAAERLLNEL